MRPRDDHLRPATAFALLQQQDLEVLADPDDFVRNLLLGRQHPLRLAQLEVDGMAVGPLDDPFHDAAHHLALVLEHVLEHLVFLSIAQPLEDDLLADLRRQPGEVLGRQGYVDQVADAGRAELASLVQADLGSRVPHGLDDAAPTEDRDLGGFGIDMHPDALRWIEGPSIGGGERRLHQAEQGLLGNALLFLDLVERLDEIRLQHQ